MGQLLNKFGKWIGDKLIEHGVRNVRRMTTPNITQLLGDFDDQIPPNEMGTFAGDDSLGRQPRKHHINIEDIDEVEVSIRLNDGKVGQLTIRGETLAVILRERAGINETTVKVEIEQPSPDEGIDVGDGLPPEEPRPIPVKPVETAEMLKAAEKIRQIRQAKALPANIPLPRQSGRSNPFA